jgi:penicillin-binding protein 1A
LVHVGGGDYDRNQFDVITQGARQPGSSFKPIMYATAFEHGVVTPHTMISNEVFFWDKDFGNPVMVHNSDEVYGGSLTVEQGIIKSYNVIAARVMVMTGPQNVVNQAHSSFGFKSKLEAYPALALGATAVSPLEMARAYSVFKTGGTRIEPYFIRRVIGPNGEVVRKYGPRYVRNAISADTARSMDTILYRAAHNGTGYPVTREGAVNARGKTGTTSDYRDAWFCGYTNRFIGVGWVGGEVKQGNAWIYPAMNRVFGGTTVGPFWGKIVKKAQETLGEELATFTPYYHSNTIEVDGDPADNQFDELPPLDPNRVPPLEEGATGTDSRPPTGRNTTPPDTRSVEIVYVEVCADSGGIANVYCPERTKKPFLKGAEPKGECPIHRPPRH